MAIVESSQVKGTVQVCTSSTRPTAFGVGHRIFETDTKREHVWDGAYWVCVRGNYQHTNAISYTATTTGTAETSASVTVPRGTWLVTASFNSEHALAGNEWIEAYITAGGVDHAKGRTTILAGTTYEAMPSLTSIITTTGATVIFLKHWRQTATGTVIAANARITAVAV